MTYKYKTVSVQTKYEVRVLSSEYQGQGKGGSVKTKKQKIKAYLLRSEMLKYFLTQAALQQLACPWSPET